jgi:Zinc knuckle
MSEHAHANESPVAQSIIAAAVAAALDAVRNTRPDHSQRSGDNADRHLPEYAWNTLPPFPTTSPGTVDSWLLSFERLMKSNRIAAESWAFQFSLCSKVPPEVHEVVVATDDPSYTSLRLALLDKFGIHKPWGYHTYRMASLPVIPGQPKTEIYSQIIEHARLRDRAAADMGLPMMNSGELIYCYIAAFGPDVQAELQKQVQVAVTHPCPLRFLHHLAPETVPYPPTHLAAMRDPVKMESAVDRTFPDRDESMGPNYAEEAALAAFPQRNNRPYTRPRPPRQQNGPYVQPNGGPYSQTNVPPCRNCGTESCAGHRRCPAYTSVCNNCGRLGHYARVCRNPGRRRQDAESTPLPTHAHFHSNPGAPNRG